MNTVPILGVDIPYDFVVGDDPGDEIMDEADLGRAVAEMAREFAGVAWRADIAAALREMKAIRFFVGAVPYRDAMLTRPFTDQDNAIFYWHAREFLLDVDPRTRASYFFHDCWHMAQFLARGGPSVDQSARILHLPVKPVTLRLGIKPLKK